MVTARVACASRRLSVNNVSELCVGSNAVATPQAHSQYGLIVWCPFCGQGRIPREVLLRDADEMVPISQVKSGDRILVGRIPEHTGHERTSDPAARVEPDAKAS